MQMNYGQPLSMMRMPMPFGYQQQQNQQRIPFRQRRINPLCDPKAWGLCRTNGRPALTSTHQITRAHSEASIKKSMFENEGQVHHPAQLEPMNKIAQYAVRQPLYSKQKQVDVTRPFRRFVAPEPQPVSNHSLTMAPPRSASMANFPAAAPMEAHQEEFAPTTAPEVFDQAPARRARATQHSGPVTSHAAAMALLQELKGQAGMTKQQDTTSAAQPERIAPRSRSYALGGDTIPINTDRENLGAIESRSRMNHSTKGVDHAFDACASNIMNFNFSSYDRNSFSKNA